MCLEVLNCAAAAHHTVSIMFMSAHMDSGSSKCPWDCLKWRKWCICLDIIKLFYIFIYISRMAKAASILVLRTEFYLEIYCRWVYLLWSLFYKVTLKCTKSQKMSGILKILKCSPKPITDCTCRLYCDCCSLGATFHMVCNEKAYILTSKLGKVSTSCGSSSYSVSQTFIQMWGICLPLLHPEKKGWNMALTDETCNKLCWVLTPKLLINCKVVSNIRGSNVILFEKKKMKVGKRRT